MTRSGRLGYGHHPRVRSLADFQFIQGPGDGYSAEEPHIKKLGGAEGNWVTADDAGFPADYIEEVGRPVIQFDLDATFRCGFPIFAADQLTGLDALELLFDAPSLGTIIFGAGSGCNPNTLATLMEEWWYCVC